MKPFDTTKINFQKSHPLSKVNALLQSESYFDEVYLDELYRNLKEQSQRVKKRANLANKTYRDYPKSKARFPISQIKLHNAMEELQNNFHSEYCRPEAHPDYLHLAVATMISHLSDDNLNKIVPYVNNLVGDENGLRNDPPKRVDFFRPENGIEKIA